MWGGAERVRAAQAAGCESEGLRVWGACGGATAGLCAAARLEGSLIGLLLCRLVGSMAV